MEVRGWVGGENCAGEVGTRGLGRGEEGRVRHRPEREIHELNVDRVEGAGVNAKEEVSGRGGARRGGGGEGEGGWVAACGVGP